MRNGIVLFIKKNNSKTKLFKLFTLFECVTFYDPNSVIELCPIYNNHDFNYLTYFGDNYILI